MTQNRSVRTVIKVGGGLLSQAAAFELVTGALTAFARGQRAVVVPGGGPFAGAVRELFRRIKIDNHAAHWMAVLGMDQYAHALAARTAGAALVETRDEIETALQDRQVPVLAPYRWLRATDPLPHSWDVTSDSIGAWFAAQLGASRIVLIKPAKLDQPRAVDPHFAKALPASIDCVILSPDDLDQLGEALHTGPTPQRAGERRSARDG